MENIKVALRVRPLSDAERLSQEENVFDIINNEHITVNRQFIKELINTKRMNLTTKISYSFDLCFDQDASNLNVFNQSVLTVSESVIHGINSTVFMYGQTGSGKTYTTLGPIGDSMNQNNPHYYQKSLQNLKQMEYDGDLGVLLLAMNHILNSIQSNKEKTFCVKCSYFEIYNENVYDLLKSKNSMDEALQLSENHSKKDFVIKGLNEVEIQSIEDILDVIYQGEENRHYAETILNHSSSRSHTIFKLYVYSYTNDQIAEFRQKASQTMGSSQMNINNQQLLEFADNHPNTLVTESCLNFVDLAGSEKISNHHYLVEDLANRDQNYTTQFVTEEQTKSAMKNVKERIKESQSINKSLFFLTQVISLQSQNKHFNHIPYRNSTLTKILKSSLGGNSRTLIVLCVTPTSTHFEQSLSTMRFGQNAKKIKNSIEVNYRRELYGNSYEKYYDYGHQRYSSGCLTQSDLEKRGGNREQEELKTVIEELKRMVGSTVAEKNEILEKLKRLMRKSIEDQLVDEESGEDLQVMLPVQLHPQAGVIFHTTETFKNNQINASLNKDICDLVFDYEGKIALGIAKKQATQLASLQHNENIMQQNFTAIQQHYLTICNDLIDQKEELNNYKWRFTLIEKKYRELREAAENALRRLDLYENMMGIHELSNEEINTIENQLFAALDKLKLEKARRIFKDEINSLKVKLGLKQSLSRSQNSSGVTTPAEPVNKHSELRSALLDKDIGELVVTDTAEDSKHEDLNKQREFIRQIFYQNINNLALRSIAEGTTTLNKGSQESDQQNKLDQIEQLMLQSTLAQQNQLSHTATFAQSGIISEAKKSQGRASRSFSKPPTSQSNQKSASPITKTNWRMVAVSSLSAGKKISNGSRRNIASGLEVTPLQQKKQKSSVNNQVKTRTSNSHTPEMRRRNRSSSQSVAVIPSSVKKSLVFTAKQNTSIDTFTATPNKTKTTTRTNPITAATQKSIRKQVQDNPLRNVAAIDSTYSTNNSSQTCSQDATQSFEESMHTSISRDGQERDSHSPQNNKQLIPSEMTNVLRQNINKVNMVNKAQQPMSKSQQDGQKLNIKPLGLTLTYALAKTPTDSRKKYETLEILKEDSKVKPMSCSSKIDAKKLSFSGMENGDASLSLLRDQKQISKENVKDRIDNVKVSSVILNELAENTSIPIVSGTQLSQLINPLREKMKEFKRNLSGVSIVEKESVNEDDYENSRNQEVPTFGRQIDSEVTTRSLLVKPQVLAQYPSKKAV